MRKPTHADAELLLRLYEVRRDPELRRARAWLVSEFDPATPWSVVKARYLSGNDEDRWFRMATSYWEMVASLVNRGVLHAELFFDHTGEDVVTWERVKGLMPAARAEIRPTYMRQFERMVVAHQAYRARANAAALAEAARTARPARTRRTRAKGR